MKHSLSKHQLIRIIMVALLGLVIGTGTTQAATLGFASPSAAPTLTCDTATGPTSTTVVINAAPALKSPATITVTLGTLPTGVNIAPANGNLGILSATVTTLTYNVSFTSPGPGCSNVTPATPTFNFIALSSVAKSVATPDLSFTVTTKVTSTTSGLTVSPSGTVALTCAVSGSAVVSAPAVTVSIGSTYPTSGTSFSVDQVTSTPIASGWAQSSAPSNGGIAIGSATGGTASTFTLTPVCTALTSGTTKSGTVYLANLPGPQKSIPVSLTVTSAPASPLTVYPASITLTCVLNTTSGTVYTPYGVAQSLSVTSAANGGTPYTVSSTAPAWLTEGTPSSLTATASSTASTISLFPSSGTSPATACGAQPLGASTFAIHLSVSGSADQTVPVTMNVIAPPPSNLLVSPASISLTCLYVDSTHATPQASAQTILVTSAAVGGTIFSLDTTSANKAPSWLTVNNVPTAQDATAASPISFTVIPASTGQCNGGGQVGTTTKWTLHLTDGPALDKTIPVTMTIVQGPTLQTDKSSYSTSYTKLSGTPATVSVQVWNLSNPVFFAVDTTTLPPWLTVNPLSATAPVSPATKTLTFTTTAAADGLPPGYYTANVNLVATNEQPVTVPISVQVNNKSSVLTVDYTSQSQNWTVGQTAPVFYVTLTSSDAPISYSVAVGGLLTSSSITQTSGLAYNFGTAIPVTFPTLPLSNAAPGSTQTGTVTITWGPLNSTIVVTLGVVIQAAGATVTSISPATLPTAYPGVAPFTVYIAGQGFVPSTDPSQRTVVGVVVNGTIVVDSNIAANVTNPSNIILSITVPATPDPYLPFDPSKTGGNVIIGICNPSGSTCSAPTGTAQLSIGLAPIISAVTSASSFKQVALPTVQKVSRYDLISIFGTNFCSSGGMGCTSSTVLSSSAPLSANADRIYPTTLYPNFPDTSGSGVSVSFNAPTGGPYTSTFSAPLLFATNTQINAAVPGGLSLATKYDIVVNYGATVAPATSSSPYTVNVQASDPGIFTVGSDGQGDAAILENGTWTPVGPTNPAAMRKTQANSDYVAIYMTGLEVPNATALTVPVCITPALYLTALDPLYSGTIDGVVLQTSVLNNTATPHAPCLTGTVSVPATLPAVTIGGQVAPVSFAGWVADSIPGLYQVNAQLPSSTAVGITNGGVFTTTSSTTPTLAAITGAIELPITVTSSSGTASQNSVTIFVQRQLYMGTTPLTNGVWNDSTAITVGVPYDSHTNNKLVTATDGNGSYSYALTGGLLPSGLFLNSDGSISGTPGANTGGTYTITVTATDTSNPPITGTITFSLSVTADLYLSPQTYGPFNFTYGTGGTTSALTATGGDNSYTLSQTVPISTAMPAGMTFTASTGVITVAGTTAAGTYPITVLATDTSATPLTGSASSTVKVALLMSAGTCSSCSATLATLQSAPTTVITQVTATGGTGLAYTIDPSSTGGFAVDSSGNVTLGTTSATGTYTVIVDATSSVPSNTNATSGGTGKQSLTITLG